MAETFLCCINDSVHARRAVELATDLAGALKGGLVFLLVNETAPASGYRDIRAMRPEDAIGILDIAVRYAHTHGVANASHCLREARDAAGAILDFAAENEIGHIVVGTGNPPFIGRLLLGSVSAAVVARAPCSVTVAR